MTPEGRRKIADRLAAGLLVVVAVCSVTGWALTVRELNALTAYRAVGSEALRAATPSGQALGHARIARDAHRSRSAD